MGDRISISFVQEQSFLGEKPKRPKLDESVGPGEYRTDHFREAMRDAIRLLKRHKEW